MTTLYSTAGMAGTAVLFSGGLDSAVLLANELDGASPVVPVHVRAGFAWEGAEASAIDRLLGRSPFAGRVGRLSTLALDMRDVYPAGHWAVVGQPPAYDTPDEDVYLEGRNITLVAKAAVLCARQRLTRLVLGPLAGNPFPDATPAFLDAMTQAMTLGLAHPLEIAAPLASLTKADVIALGQRLGVPLKLTWSCMRADGPHHCGRCSKCRERQEAYAHAGLADPTDYAVIQPSTGPPDRPARAARRR